MHILYKSFCNAVTVSDFYSILAQGESSRLSGWLCPWSCHFIQVTLMFGAFESWPKLISVWAQHCMSLTMTDGGDVDTFVTTFIVQP